MSLESKNQMRASQGWYGISSAKMRIFAVKSFQSGESVSISDAFEIQIFTKMIMGRSSNIIFLKCKI